MEFPRDLTHFYSSHNTPQLVIIRVKERLNGHEVEEKKFICNAVVVAAHSAVLNSLILEGRHDFDLCWEPTLKAESALMKCFKFMHGCVDIDLGEDGDEILCCSRFAFHWDIKGLENVCFRKVASLVSQSPSLVPKFHVLLQFTTTIRQWDMYENLLLQSVERNMFYLRSIIAQLSEEEKNVFKIYFEKCEVFDVEGCSPKVVSTLYKGNLNLSGSKKKRATSLTKSPPHVAKSTPHVEEELDNWEDISTSSSDYSESDSENASSEKQPLKFKSLELFYDRDGRISIQAFPLFTQLDIIANFICKMDGITPEAMMPYLEPLLNDKTIYARIPELLIEHVIDTIRSHFLQLEKTLPSKMEINTSKKTRAKRIRTFSAVADIDKPRRFWWEYRNNKEIMVVETFRLKRFRCLFPKSQCNQIHVIEKINISFHSKTKRLRIRIFPENFHLNNIIHCYLVGITRKNKAAGYMSLTERPINKHSFELKTLHRHELHILFSHHLESSGIFNNVIDRLNLTDTV